MADFRDENSFDGANERGQDRDNDDVDDAHDPEGEAGEEEDVQHALVYGTKAIAVSSNKPLTSKFRGVCWNKKNKRWQAAINSSGKYLYLGSYDTEEEAARVFDKAAVRIRGQKARLNFRYRDYVDDQGCVLPDPQVEALLLEACNPTKPRRQRTKGKGKDDQCPSGLEGAMRQSADASKLGMDSGFFASALADAAPGTDKVAAEIALQALARLCGPLEGALPSALPRAQAASGLDSMPSSRTGAPSLSMDVMDGRKNQLLKLLDGSAFGQPQQTHPMLGPLTSLGTTALGNPGNILQAARGGTMLPTLQLDLDRHRAATATTASVLQMQAQQSGTLPQQAPPAAPQLPAAPPPPSAPAAPPSSANDIFSSLQNHLPEGATLDSIIPSGSDAVLGVLYSLKNNEKTGAGIWNGRSFHNLGMYGSDKDAKQACQGSLQLFKDMNLSSTPPAPAPATNAAAARGGPAGTPNNLFKTTDDLDAAAGPCARPSVGDSSNQQMPYSILAVPSMGVDTLLAMLPQRPEANMNALDTGNAGMKFEQVYLNPGGWQLQVQQPDPVGDGVKSSAVTQEVTDESASDKRQREDLNAANGHPNKRLKTTPVSVEFATLQQLATIDVQEALQLFFASKQMSQ
mmetsp:Transcript_25523/g.55548  ORF Transcript_25523/g.55548 Transcript_25523/m.55548 type:complete len:630 (-) Transcript_25523:1007-2896(-)|eukprot:CAMPEP_0202914592 /NCGR_PEP_ID=MMETSP1392-20130828/63472_1 /ASSEMBLY_ACC=CAM_ASM_000868 /TAXON_ID=225041 /ORGANISM="Chlamydomonas chlamydogama, Strain SAG 11-48b" /LENGTH=629 /DNA_ID=CAMNT_0049606289 /DNA_START=155 /DNA_END=2044 /DNA_ORIENTATION=+